MSWYVGLAGLIVTGVGHTLAAIATIISAVKGNQSEDSGEKAALRAAAGFIGISILFQIIAVVLGIILAGTKGCSKKNRIAFIIFTLLFVISYVIGLVIIGIYWRRKQAAGDTQGARDLQAALLLPLVAIPLYIVGFILLYIFLGRRLRSARRFCKQAQQYSGKEF